MDNLQKTKIENSKARLDAYYKAEMAILSGQSYQIGTRRLDRANLAEVRKAIETLEEKITDLESDTSGKRKVMRVVPLDL